MTKLCSVCSAENRDEALFCRACGTPFAVSPAAASFGAEASVENICSECGFRNKPGIRYCANCGMSLAGAENEAPPGDLAPAAAPGDPYAGLSPPPISYASFATVAPYPPAPAAPSGYPPVFEGTQAPDIPDADAAITIRQQEAFETRPDFAPAGAAPSRNRTPARRRRRRRAAHHRRRRRVAVPEQLELGAARCRRGFGAGGRDRTGRAGTDAGDRGAGCAPPPVVGRDAEVAARRRAGAVGARHAAAGRGRAVAATHRRGRSRNRRGRGRNGSPPTRSGARRQCATRPSAMPRRRRSPTSAIRPPPPRAPSRKRKRADAQRKRCARGRAPPPRRRLRRSRKRAA